MLELRWRKIIKNTYIYWSLFLIQFGFYYKLRYALVFLHWFFFPFFSFIIYNIRKYQVARFEHTFFSFSFFHILYQKRFYWNIRENRMMLICVLAYGSFYIYWKFWFYYFKCDKWVRRLFFINSFEILTRLKGLLFRLIQIPTKKTSSNCNN